MPRQGKVFPPQAFRPEGPTNVLGILRPVSRMVGGAARAETPFSRAFDACYGYFPKYNLPFSKASVSVVGPAVVRSQAAGPGQYAARGPRIGGAAAQVVGSRLGGRRLFAVPQA